MNMLASGPLNTIDENTNPLASLVNFESTIEKIDIEQPIKVQLLTDKRLLKLDYRGTQILGSLERPLIHQLGSRLWPEENDFDAINARWKKLAASAPSILEQEVANLFCHHDLQLRVFPGKGSHKMIYGVVSPHFIDVNQVNFRDAYIEQSRQITQVNARSLGIGRDNYGNIVELRTPEQ